MGRARRTLQSKLKSTPKRTREQKRAVRTHLVKRKSKKV